MPTPTTFPAYDRIVPGGLELLLRSARDEGTSLRGIVAQLADDHAITVSVETVRGWCRDLGIPTSRSAA